MRYITLIVFFALTTITAASADDSRKAFYGTWGTEKQCKRELIKPGGTVLAAPVEIDDKWLQQGNIWCKLNWLPVQTRENGFFSGAHASCGEDSVRNYLLRMELDGDSLTLRWDFLQGSKNSLKRCVGS